MDNGPSRWRRLSRAAVAVAVTTLLGAACSSGGSKAAPESTLPAEIEPAPTTTIAPESPTSAATNPSGRQVPSFVISPTVRSDCTVDVSADIQSWIESRPDNAHLLLTTGGCYRVNETIVIENRHGLVLDGRGATFKATSVGNRTRQEVAIAGGSDLTIRNLTVRGPNRSAGATPSAYHRSLEAQHAFQIGGATNVLLDHVQAFDVYGDFVYIGPANGRASRNVTIRRSIFQRSGRQGISVTDAENVTIQGNTISDSPQSIFDLEPNTASEVVRAIRIIGNTTGAAHNFWFANKGARADVGDIQITGNRMTAATGGLIFVYASGGAYRGPFLIENNRLLAGNSTHDEKSTGALFFAHARDVTIRGNSVIFPQGAAMPATEFRDSHQVQMDSNTFTNAGRKVLSTDDSSGLSVG